MIRVLADGEAEPIGDAIVAHGFRGEAGHKGTDVFENGHLKVPDRDTAEKIGEQRPGFNPPFERMFAPISGRP